MRKIPKRAQLPVPEPIYIEVDPREMNNTIQIPKIRYRVVADFDTEEVFHGRIYPIPKVLIYYLNHTELLLLTTIMEVTDDKGDCILPVKELSKMTRLSTATVSSSLYTLRRAGLLLEAPNGQRGSGRIRKINYPAIQHLNDLTEGEDPGVYVRIRKATRKTNIEKLTKADIKGAYDNHVVDPDNDPAEWEEYD